MNPAGHFEIHAFACSDVGRSRGTNEDSFLIADLTEQMRIERNGVLRFRSASRGALFAVADGMGGAAAGEMASKIALRTLYQEVQELARVIRDRDDELMEQILMEAVGSANRRVFSIGRSSGEYEGMGTTLTAILEFRGRLAIGQIGDSRAYLLRHDGIRQLTRDQSLVGERVSMGEITEEQARRHPQRNVLLQALGVRPAVELVLKTATAAPGDVILLCSDGLHSQMSNREIYEVVAHSASPENACLDLVDLANSRGGPDNITAVLVQFL